MEIHASCKFDFDAIRALTYVGVRKRRKPTSGLIFSICLLILYSVLSVLLFVESGEFSFNLSLLAVIILPCFELFALYGIPKMRYKALGKLQGMENRYVFQDRGFLASSSNDVHNGQSNTDYAVLMKAYETSKYFFLFISKNQAYIVDKATVSGGPVDDLRGKLQSILGKKYYICKY